MRIVFYFGHPSQYLFLRETMRRLSKFPDYQIHILIKTKDVLEDLLKNDGFDYINILPQVRGNLRLSVAWSVYTRFFLILPIIRKIKPNLLVGTDATIAQLGKLLNINRITITEDDYAVIKMLGNLSYPFTQTILCPQVCDVGRWNNKKIGYDGYMKLGYLHPNVFQIKDDVIKKYKISSKFILIRLSRLNAHHDFGIKGIDNLLLNKIIELSNSFDCQVCICSEGVIPYKYQPYKLNIDPSDLHQILAKATILVSDSQSMSLEAALLGVPSLRYSGFAGKISVLEELEHTYQLTFGIKIGEKATLLKKLEEWLTTLDLQNLFQERRHIMLKDKIDVTAFTTWFIANYPDSASLMKKQREIQNQFETIF